MVGVGRGGGDPLSAPSTASSPSCGACALLTVSLSLLHAQRTRQTRHPMRSPPLLPVPRLRSTLGPPPPRRSPLASQACAAPRAASALPQVDPALQSRPSPFSSSSRSSPRVRRLSRSRARSRRARHRPCGANSSRLAPAVERSVAAPDEHPCPRRSRSSAPTNLAPCSLAPRLISTCPRAAPRLVSNESMFAPEHVAQQQADHLFLDALSSEMQRLGPQLGHTFDPQAYSHGKELVRPLPARPVLVWVTCSPSLAPTFPCRRLGSASPTSSTSCVCSSGATACPLERGGACDLTTPSSTTSLSSAAAASVRSSPFSSSPFGALSHTVRPRPADDLLPCRPADNDPTIVVVPSFDELVHTIRRLDNDSFLRFSIPHQSALDPRNGPLRPIHHVVGPTSIPHDGGHRALGNWNPERRFTRWQHRFINGELGTKGTPYQIDSGASVPSP